MPDVPHDFPFAKTARCRTRRGNKGKKRRRRKRRGSPNKMQTTWPILAPRIRGKPKEGTFPTALAIYRRTTMRPSSLVACTITPSTVWWSTRSRDDCSGPGWKFRLKYRWSISLRRQQGGGVLSFDEALITRENFTNASREIGRLINKASFFFFKYLALISEEVSLVSPRFRFEILMKRGTRYIFRPANYRFSNQAMES